MAKGYLPEVTTQHYVEPDAIKSLRIVDVCELVKQIGDVTVKKQATLWAVCAEHNFYEQKFGMFPGYFELLAWKSVLQLTRARIEQWIAISVLVTDPRQLVHAEAAYDHQMTEEDSAAKQREFLKDLGREIRYLLMLKQYAKRAGKLANRAASNFKLPNDRIAKVVRFFFMSKQEDIPHWRISRHAMVLY